MDEWEVNQETGEMKNVKETDRDVLFVVDNKEKRIKDSDEKVKSQDIGEKHSMSKKTGTIDSQNDKLEPIKVNYTGLNFKTEESSDKAFNFLADNTDVEWSQITSTSNIGENPKNNSSIYTSHRPKEEHAGAYFALRLKTSNMNLIKFSHSHPRFEPDGYKTSESDVATKDVLLKVHPDAIFKLRWGGGRDRIYNKDKLNR
ncbi:MAG: JAB-like toxin 1 domain-containing protein [Bacteroidales bacterium]